MVYQDNEYALGYSKRIQIMLLRENASLQTNWRWGLYMMPEISFSPENGQVLYGPYLKSRAEAMQNFRQFAECILKFSESNM